MTRDDITAAIEACDAPTIQRRRSADMEKTVVIATHDPFVLEHTDEVLAL